MKTPNETIAGYICGTVICVAALASDGITAITLSIGVASAIVGTGGYIAGRVRKLRSP